MFIYVMKINKYVFYVLSSFCCGSSITGVLGGGGLGLACYTVGKVVRTSVTGVLYILVLLILL